MKYMVYNTETYYPPAPRDPYRVAGPFESRAEAERAATAMIAQGAQRVSIEEVRS